MDSELTAKEQLAALESLKTVDEKISFLIEEKKKLLAVELLEQKKKTFYKTKETVIAKHETDGVAAVEALKLKVFTEKNELVEKWAKAEATGTFDIPA